MHVTSFVAAVLTVHCHVPFSVTSWMRTPAHNKAVNGVADSYHLCGLGIDIVLDNPSDRPIVEQEAKRVGLSVLDEQDHLHLQPL